MPEFLLTRRFSVSFKALLHLIVASVFIPPVPLLNAQSDAAPVAISQPLSPVGSKIEHSSAGSERISRQVCGSCHQFPEPDVVDKKTWKEQILPRMETRLGISPPDYSSSPEGALLKSLELYPESPLIPKSDWDAIVDYYLSKAPAEPLPQDQRAEIRVGLSQFEMSAIRYRHNPPLTTVATIGSGKRFYLGDDRAKVLSILGGDGQLVESLRLDNVPISIHETEQGIYVTAIGSFQPSEHQNGALLFCPKTENGFGSPKTILKNLPRAVHAEFCDFNKDGKMDFALCLFGNHRGRFSWYENLGNDEYKEHILMERSGAIRSVAHDFNNDGSPDIGLLMAQETEAFYIFTNDGKGHFSSQAIFQKHPAFGHCHFELADFDKDGRPDLLVTNGDNGEYDSPMKKYHGIRIYLNKGENRFEERYFFPLNGAVKASAKDFDGDGDLDIAAISFFPDYVKSPRESFVYLENKGSWNFSPLTFPQCISGRWVAMDIGDVDGDDDLDILLGSYIRGPTSVPAFLSQLWEKQSPSLLILRNTRSKK